MSGGKAGRPKLPEGAAKAAVINVRLSPDEKHAIEGAAANEGVSVSEWARAMLMSAAEAAYIIPTLRKAILDLHGCDSAYVDLAVVKEAGMPPGWDGEVFIYDLMGHPLAERAYAWSYPATGTKRKFVVTLHAGPVDSPQSAVHAYVANRVAN